MARIRSDKPEAYQSETLAEISLAAERTFKGMATIVDDRGRIADKPAQINGELWSMRGGHTRDDLEAELDEMVKVELVCRYAGCDGKRYLHLVRWDQHQKIDRPSKSRAPRCPFHQVKEDYCGLHEGECKPPETSPDSPESSRHPREGSRGLQPPQTGHRETGAQADHTDQGELIAVGAPDPRANGQVVPEQAERKSSRRPREASMQDLGSRTVDRGPIQTPSVSAGQTAGELTITQRSKRLTDAYAAAVPMCKWIAVNGIVLSAIKSGKFSDDEIRAALLRLAADNRPVTIDSLRTELVGIAPRTRGAPSEPSSAADQRRADVARLREIDRQQRGDDPPGAIQGSVIA